MSDIRTADEGAEETQVDPVAAEAEAKAIWLDLQKEGAGQADTGTLATNAEVEGKTGADGQVESTPEGQARSDTPTGDAGKPPASTATDDPWKDANPELRAAYERERDARVQAENVVKVHAGRLTQAYRERDTLAAQLTEKAAPQQEGGESDEDYRKRMTEEFPDFARLFDKLDAAEQKVSKLEQQGTTLQQSQTETALQEQQAILETAHPTYREYVIHPEDLKKPADQARPHPDFLAWIAKQPGYVHDALRANAKEIVDGQSAADIITRFRAETAPSAAQQKEAQRRQEQLDAARQVDTRTPAGTGKGEETPEEIWADLKAKAERKK